MTAAAEQAALTALNETRRALAGLLADQTASRQSRERAADAYQRAEGAYRTIRRRRIERERSDKAAKPQRPISPEDSA